jgi:DNA-binding beta-propeller fold protein YncE
MKRTKIATIAFVSLLVMSKAVLGVPIWSVVTSYPYPQVNNGSSSALAYDGSNLLFLTQQPWAEDIYFLQPLTGAVVRQITPAGNLTIGSMTWDGQYIRVSNVTIGSGTVNSIDPFTGAQVGSIPVPAGAGERIEGLAYDGYSLFLTDISEVFEVDPATGALRNSYVTGYLMFGLEWVGDNILFGAVPDKRQIVAFDKSTGVTIYSFGAPGSGDPQGLAFDGTYLYVADQASNTIYVMVPEPATVLLLGLGGMSLLRRRR